MNKDLANRLKEVLLNGKWIANTNFKEQITSISWEQAIEKVENLNTIALLTFHVNYYVKGILNLSQGAKHENRDKYRIDMTVISSETDRLNLVNYIVTYSENFISNVEKKDDNL